MLDLQVNDREHTDLHCDHHDSDMRCTLHHHCDTDAVVDNDNICYIIYNFDMYRSEDSVLVHHNFCNVLLVT